MRVGNGRVLCVLSVGCPHCRDVHRSVRRHLSLFTLSARQGIGDAAKDAQKKAGQAAEDVKSQASKAFDDVVNQGEDAIKG